MSTVIVALLVVAAVVLLVGSWFSGRRDRDPAASVHSFQRAMTAMGHEATDAAATSSRSHHAHDDTRPDSERLDDERPDDTRPAPGATVVRR